MGCGLQEPQRRGHLGGIVYTDRADSVFVIIRYLF